MIRSAAKAPNAFNYQPVHELEPPPYSLMAADETESADSSRSGVENHGSENERATARTTRVEVVAQLPAPLLPLSDKALRVYASWRAEARRDQWPASSWCCAILGALVGLGGAVGGMCGFALLVDQKEPNNGAVAVSFVAALLSPFLGFAFYGCAVSIANEHWNRSRRVPTDETQREALAAEALGWFRDKMSLALSKRDFDRLQEYHVDADGPIACCTPPPTLEVVRAALTAAVDDQLKLALLKALPDTHNGGLDRTDLVMAAKAGDGLLEEVLRRRREAGCALTYDDFYTALCWQRDKAATFVVESLAQNEFFYFTPEDISFCLTSRPAGLALLAVAPPACLQKVNERHLETAANCSGTLLLCALEVNRNNRPVGYQDFELALRYRRFDAALEVFNALGDKARAHADIGAFRAALNARHSLLATAIVTHLGPEARTELTGQDWLIACSFAPALAEKVSGLRREAAAMPWPAREAEARNAEPPPDPL